MIAAVVTAAALAATPITLDQVREQSRQNVQAVLAELDNERSQQQIRTSKSQVYPQVSLGATVSGAAYSVQRAGGLGQLSIDQPATTRGNYDLNVTATQLIYDGGKWWNRIAQAGAQEEATRGQFQEQQLASVAEGVRRFYELYRAQQRQIVLDANLKRSLDQVARAQGLFEAGRINRSDLLSSQVNAGNDKITLIQSRARIASAQADLAAWLAHPAAEDLVAENPPFGGEKQQLVLADEIGVARSNRPLYRSLDAQVRSAELSVEIARGDYRPRVGAQVRADRQSTSLDVFLTEPTHNDSISGGLSLTWDIFNGFATNAAAESARLQQRTAQVNLDQALRELEGDVKKAIVQLEVTQEATDVAASNQQMAAEALKVAEGRFSSGAGSTLEVRDAQLKLTQAELTLLESRIDTEIARANLDRVLGNGVKP